MVKKERINLGLMGLGVVGSGVARILGEKAETIERQIGCPLVLKKILVRSPKKERAVSVDTNLLTTNAEHILADPQIDIVIELIGGEAPAFEYICRALDSGKHVVTANKEVMAKHGAKLRALAQENQVNLYYEASVGGGIPLIMPFKQELLANDISSLSAIINGTTNYILTRMAREGIDFEQALSEAQALGYAEADPSNDIDGVDAAYKLAILATLAFHVQVLPEDVFKEGISNLRARDFQYADELGYSIKLLAIAKEHDGGVQARVHPTLIPQDMLLAKVDGVFNAVQVEGDLVGRMLFYGRGAGSLPTTSAVISDLMDLSQDINAGVNNRHPLRLDDKKHLWPISEVETRYYLCLIVPDQAGVLAKIAQVLGDNQVSIASVIQKETDETDQTAEIVIMTHMAKESAMQVALEELEKIPKLAEVGSFIRVES